MANTSGRSALHMDCTPRSSRSQSPLADSRNDVNVLYDDGSADKYRTSFFLPPIGPWTGSISTHLEYSVPPDSLTGIHKPEISENRTEAMNREAQSPLHNSSTSSFSEGLHSSEPNLPSSPKPPRAYEQQPASLEQARPRDLIETGEDAGQPTQSRAKGASGASCFPPPSLLENAQLRQAAQAAERVDANRAPPAPTNFHDHQLQLILLEQENTRRFTMARVEQDSILRRLQKEESRKRNSNPSTFPYSSFSPPPPPQSPRQMIMGVSFAPSQEHDVQFVLLEHQKRNRLMLGKEPREGEEIDDLTASQVYARMHPSVQAEVRRRFAKEDARVITEEHMTEGDEVEEEQAGQAPVVQVYRTLEERAAQVVILGEGINKFRRNGVLMSGRDIEHREIQLSHLEQDTVQWLTRAREQRAREEQVLENRTLGKAAQEKAAQAIPVWEVNSYDFLFPPGHEFHEREKQLRLLEQNKANRLMHARGEYVKLQQHDKEVWLQEARERDAEKCREGLIPTFPLDQQYQGTYEDQNNERQFLTYGSSDFQVQYQKHGEHVQEMERLETLNRQEIQREQGHQDKRDVEDNREPSPRPFTTDSHIPRKSHFVRVQEQKRLNMEKRQARQRALGRLQRTPMPFPLPHRTPSSCRGLFLNEVDQKAAGEGNPAVDSDNTLGACDDAGDAPETAEQPPSPERCPQSPNTMRFERQFVNLERDQETRGGVPAIEAAPTLGTVENPIEIDGPDEQSTSQTITAANEVPILLDGPKVTIITITMVTTVTITTNPTDIKAAESTVTTSTTTKTTTTQTVHEMATAAELDLQ